MSLHQFLIPQKYLSNKTYIIYGVIFMITLILSSCKNEPENKVDPNASEFEKQYFKDYTAPVYKWGYINTTGQFEIKPIYDDVRDFKDGIACASLNGKWGMINKKGEIVIPHTFLNIQDFSEGFALVENFNNEFYYINESGQRAFNCPSSECYSFKSGLARYVDKGIVGFINNEGKILEDLRFSGASDFENGITWIQLGIKTGIINKQGEYLIPLMYDKVKINEDIAMTRDLEGVVKYFDLQNNRWLVGEYNYGSEFNDGFATVKDDTDYSIVNSKGEKTYSSKSKIKYINENRWALKTNNYYNIIDQKGKVLSDTTFSNIFKYNCGVAGIEINKNWGYVNHDGKIILEPSLPIIWDCSENLIRFISRNGFGFMDAETEIKIAPKFYEVRDFNEGLARAQEY